MATGSFNQIGRYLPFVAPTGGVVSGQVVVLRSGTSGKIAICMGALGAVASAGQTVQVDTEGVWTLPSDTGTAYAQGDTLYWTGTTLTKTSTGNTLAGMCTAAKTSGGTSASVKLNRT